jgi:type I restriction enzyme S subunit
MTVPDGWTSQQLGKVLGLLPGYAFPSSEFDKVYPRVLPLVRIRDLTDQNPSTGFRGSIPDGYVVNHGDILIGMDGDFTICRWFGPTSLLNQRICKVWSSNPSTLDQDYLYYLLKPHIDVIHAQISATTVKHLSTKHLKKISAILPPLPEQKKIAEILGSVDEAIRTTRETIEQTKRLKKGLLQQLLTRGIGHTRFKQTEIGEIPEEWEVVRVSRLLQDKGALTYGILQPGPHIPTGVPMLRGVDIEDGRLANTTILRVDPSIEHQYTRTRLHGDEILLSIMGTVGKSLVVNESMRGFNVNRALAVIRLSGEVHREFFYYWLTSPAMQRFFELQTIGSAQKRINLSDFRKLRLALPSLREQREILSVLSCVDLTHGIVLSSLFELMNTKQGLMQDLLSGIVRVRV